MLQQASNGELYFDDAPTNYGALDEEPIIPKRNLIYMMLDTYFKNTIDKEIDRLTSVIEKRNQGMNAEEIKNELRKLDLAYKKVKEEIIELRGKLKAKEDKKEVVAIPAIPAIPETGTMGTMGTTKKEKKKQPYISKKG